MWKRVSLRTFVKRKSSLWNGKVQGCTFLLQWHEQSKKHMQRISHTHTHSVQLDCSTHPQTTDVFKDASLTKWVPLHMLWMAPYRLANILLNWWKSFRSAIASRNQWWHNRGTGWWDLVLGHRFLCLLIWHHSGGLTDCSQNSPQRHTQWEWNWLSSLNINVGIGAAEDQTPWNKHVWLESHSQYADRCHVYHKFWDPSAGLLFAQTHLMPKTCHHMNEAQVCVKSTMCHLQPCYWHACDSSCLFSLCKETLMGFIRIFYLNHPHSARHKQWKEDCLCEFISASASALWAHRGRMSPLKSGNGCFKSAFYTAQSQTWRIEITGAETRVSRWYQTI